MVAALNGSCAMVDSLSNPKSFKSYWQSYQQRSCAEEVQERHKPAMPDLDTIRASKHHPLLVTPDPGAILKGQTINGSADVNQAVPINGGAFEADGSLFKVRSPRRDGGGGGGKHKLAGNPCAVLLGAHR